MMDGVEKIPPVVWVVLISVFAAVIAFFVRMWIRQKDKVDETQNERIALLRERVSDLENKLKAHTDSLREGRTAFRDLRMEMAEKMSKTDFHERHEELKRVVDRVEETLDTVRLDLQTIKTLLKENGLVKKQTT